MDWNEANLNLQPTDMFSTWREHHNYLRNYLDQYQNIQRRNASMVNSYLDWYRPRDGQHSLRYLDLVENCVNGIGYVEIPGPVTLLGGSTWNYLGSLAFECIGEPVVFMCDFLWTVVSTPTVHFYVDGTHKAEVRSGGSLSMPELSVGNHLLDLYGYNGTGTTFTMYDIHCVSWELKR